MAIITSYSTLVQALKDKLEDDGSEFADFLPVAIDNSEERLFRELDLPELEENQTGSLTAGTQTLDKPTGYRFCEYLIIITDNKRISLRKKKSDFIQDYWPDPTETDTPKYYSDESLTNFILAPTPDDSYSYRIKFTKKPQKLSTTNPSNYYIEKCNDILFSACLMEMAEFMKAWDQLNIWKQEYSELKDGWNLQAMRYRRDGGAVPMSPKGGNTLKHTINTGA